MRKHTACSLHECICCPQLWDVYRLHFNALRAKVSTLGMIVTRHKRDIGVFELLLLHLIGVCANGTTHPQVHYCCHTQCTAKAPRSAAMPHFASGRGGGLRSEANLFLQRALQPQSGRKNGSHHQYLTTHGLGHHTRSLPNTSNPCAHAARCMFSATMPESTNILIGALKILALQRSSTAVQIKFTGACFVISWPRSAFHPRVAHPLLYAFQRPI